MRYYNFKSPNALQEAKKANSKHELIVLNKRDSDVFFNTLLNPPNPNHALQDAFAVHEEMTGPDNS